MWIERQSRLLALLFFVLVACATPRESPDVDGDGYVAADDCDDTDADVRPGADERCDGVDQDCDGEVDEGPVDGFIAYIDEDGDDRGAGPALAVCRYGVGVSDRAGDCADDDSYVHPDADETCSPVDENCDGDA